MKPESHSERDIFCHIWKMYHSNKLRFKIPMVSENNSFLVGKADTHTSGQVLKYEIKIFW